ncbi:type II toxin-antitoxin system RelE/ParE family toxin [Rhizobium sp. SAFR-030]|uniref:type II toxin-antitoxin system RelE/ParE family toxin n=1 Tax=Rhizobium sp. SAFR-030 TaxID=3387277 RepID=UPI003F803A02
MAFIITPRAKADMLETVLYISNFNPVAARSWRREILETCRLLSQMPLMGHALEPNVSTGSLDGVRLFSKNKHLIFFKRRNADVEILRVLHAARDWPKLVR